MGLQCAGFDVFAFHPPQPCTAVIHMDHQLLALLNVLARFCLRGVFRGDTGMLQKASESQNPVGIEKWMLWSRRCVQHQGFAAVQFQLQAVF